jgi:hypothetical protein
MALFQLEVEEVLSKVELRITCKKLFNFVFVSLRKESFIFSTFVIALIKTFRLRNFQKKFANKFSLFSLNSLFSQDISKIVKSQSAHFVNYA